VSGLAIQSRTPDPPLSGDYFGISGRLANAEANKLGRLHGRQSHETDQSAIVQIILRHRRPVASDEECIFRFVAEKRAIAPEHQQKIFHRAAYIRPQARVVRLEHGPLRPVSNECSTKIKTRCRLTYFHSGSELTVLARQTGFPRRSKKRNTLIPSGFNASFFSLLMSDSKRVRSSIISFDGAL
jgi:hypothetical protein